MDCISPEHPEPQLSATFVKVALNAIRAAIPFDADDSGESHEEKYQAAVELFHAQKPRNPDEAALATRYVIGHVRYLHLSARAAARDLDDDKVVRLNAAAATADRLANTTRRAILDAQRPAPAPGQLTRTPAAASQRATPGPVPAGADGWIRLAPDAQPIAHYPRFQPRDRDGAPIPLNRSELMTMAQRRATYASPRDPELEAAAIAEEEEMIAAQAAQQTDAAMPSA